LSICIAQSRVTFGVRRGASFLKEHFLSLSISSDNGHGVPELVARVADVMADYGKPWCMCGGWAVDAWIGKQTREHGDMDVSVLVQDQRALFEHLRGWQLIAHDFATPGAQSRVEVPGATSRLWDGTHRIETSGHLHARLASGEPIPEILGPESGFWLDILFNDGSSEDWIVSRDPFISVPMPQAVQHSRWGLPTAAPEVLLFDKSKYLRWRDKLDFIRLLPRLRDEQRAWLRDAIERVGHPWVTELSATNDEAMV
jgi:Aminoglycoside-2''-adenylyltransferase